jgi:hypothetical protein
VTDIVGSFCAVELYLPVFVRNAMSVWRPSRACAWFYTIVYSQGNVLNSALARLESEPGAVEAIREIVTFARQSRRGIGRVRDKAAEPAPDLV